MIPRRGRQSYRTVSGLKFAAPCKRPGFIPFGRPRGVKAVGVRYERAVAKAIPAASHNPWFEFMDERGIGVCNPDLLLDAADRMVVLECKLTDVAEADQQLAKLYIPVVRLAYRKHTTGIIVVRHLTRATDTSRVVDSLSAALASPCPIPILHWLGRGPI